LPIIIRRNSIFSTHPALLALMKQNFFSHWPGNSDRRHQPAATGRAISGVNIDVF
jgi:hypothetical protein